MTTAEPSTWALRADLAQASLDHFFGAPHPQYLNNTVPNEAGDNATFNYWWIAHVVDVRLDAFERTRDPRWLEQARVAHRNVLVRNGGSLFNDYFDDMLWYALAILRMHSATEDEMYLEQARAIWDHVVENGWNDHLGPSLAWRKQQLDYKNTPANGPLVILSARLSALGDDRAHLPTALAAFRWITDTLVDESTGFVQDGINRVQDGRIDTQWRFTYNQGLYVGAAVELYRRTAQEHYLARATRTALHAIAALATDGVFRDEGDGGDEGLFKGVFYRYVGQLLAVIDPDSGPAQELRAFIGTSVDALWRTSRRDGFLLAGNDWTRPAPGKVAYSTQLSAITALEVRARL